MFKKGCGRCGKTDGHKNDGGRQRARRAKRGARGTGKGRGGTKCVCRRHRPRKAREVSKWECVRGEKGERSTIVSNSSSMAGEAQGSSARRATRRAVAGVGWQRGSGGEEDDLRIAGW